MTARERWRAVLNGERPDRTPCDYWGTGEITARLMRDLGCANERELWDKLGVDKCIYLAARHPRAVENDWHIPSLFSIWHVGTKKMPYADGLGTYEEAVSFPLAEAETVADIERFDWPDPNEWDVEWLARACAEWPDNPILGGSFEPFYLYCKLRGMERALEDLVANPALAEAGLERIFQVHEGVIRRSLERMGGRIDFIYVAEDLGTQESLLMSPRLFRRFIKPLLARMAELAHSYGAKAFHHDDGAIRPLIPDLIEIGIDILNPIQWRCRGMEREGLARDFGSRLVFHGGVDNQQTLPFGTPADVRREVADNLKAFRDCRGYVVAPCHNLQANTPTENVVALYDAVHELG
jgi:uroporphyrinogen decarboxylase